LATIEQINVDIFIPADHPSSPFESPFEGDKAWFMYAPFAYTARRGFLAHPQSHLLDVRVVQNERNLTLSAAAYQSSLGRLRKGDFFILLGKLQYALVPWAAMHGRGVRTVQWSLDPSRVCGNPQHDLWSYSWASIAPCLGRTRMAAELHGPTLQQYMPAGFTPSYARAKPHAHNASADPVFFGKLTESRASLLSELNRRIAPAKIVHVDGIWTEPNMARLLEKHSLFLNLHQTPARVHLEPRLSVLLSAGALVVSERCHVLDEYEYTGLVDFVDRARLADALLRVLSLSADERGALVQGRQAAFARRFDPGRLFDRAGVWDQIDRSIADRLKSVLAPG
jgi:hypothetical protein